MSAAERKAALDRLVAQKRSGELGPPASSSSSKSAHSSKPKTSCGGGSGRSVLQAAAIGKPSPKLDDRKAALDQLVAQKRSGDFGPAASSSSSKSAFKPTTSSCGIGRSVLQATAMGKPGPSIKEKDRTHSKPNSKAQDRTKKRQHVQDKDEEEKEAAKPKKVKSRLHTPGTLIRNQDDEDDEDDEDDDFGNKSDECDEEDDGIDRSNIVTSRRQRNKVNYAAFDADADDDDF
mmetsp:Transcript_58131/g.96008  ORF Transcript_58131/g.96008 Transcript_58131/m.96008 type:complete len:233 (+) Transcript_58131:40-738(+)|eukprot:CAMPEP_0119305062 /NCGR_PEP_ID=MMETSP1333-20130426/6140_1 /TAXON_ID=418940 /ORGANISM="Scyphosphaera apsteinii, Strain RCC1455" /LENGTH=232 /DNA_ID=CAMNT_0007308063 /DNA_START=47 /DNA_END=745 /DNA_ORIENTATION=+